MPNYCNESKSNLQKIHPNLMFVIKAIQAYWAENLESTYLKVAPILKNQTGMEVYDNEKHFWLPQKDLKFNNKIFVAMSQKKKNDRIK